MGIEPGSLDPKRNELLAKVKEGMKVVDVNGDDVGEVAFVHMADINDPDDNPGMRDNNVALFDLSDDDGDRGLLSIFGGDSAVTERMRRSGFVRVDASGIFTGDRYVVPHQIDGVQGDTLRLSVDKDNIPDPA